MESSSGYSEANISTEKFTNSSIGQKYASLELAEVFKIEHESALEIFDENLQKEKGSILKGLFIPITQQQIWHTTVFGF